MLEFVKKDPAVYAELLNDPALVPVFLVKLDPFYEAIGPVEVSNASLLKEIGGEEMIQKYSGFRVGSAKIAAKLLELGFLHLIVGVTDRSSEETLPHHPKIKVANGRQCYFPLPDGTWLAVKGSGQNQNFEKAPYFYKIENPNLFHDGRLFHEGAALLEELQNALLWRNDFIAEPVPQIIAYRRILRIPDGNGRFLDIKELKQRKLFLLYANSEFNPVLSFSRVLSPHRLIKLPQLVKTDPQLKRTRYRVFQALKAINKNAKEFKTQDDFFKFILRQLAKVEAKKTNLNIGKNTLNWQDFTFAGEEADNEEWATIGDLAKRPLKVEHNGIFILDFNVKVEVMFHLLASKESLQNKQTVIDYWQTFFSTYFSHLEDKKILKTFIGVENDHFLAERIAFCWLEAHKRHSKLQESVLSSDELIQLITNLASKELLTQELRNNYFLQNKENFFCSI